MSSYQQSRKIRTYAYSPNALAESSLRLTASHDKDPGKRSFQVEEKDIEQGLNFFCHPVIDCEKLEDDTGFGASDVELVVSIRCTSSRWASAFHRTYPDADQEQLFRENVMLHISSDTQTQAPPGINPDDFGGIYGLPPDDISGTLSIVMMVVLRDDQNTENSFEASRLGQILSQKKFRVVFGEKGKGFQNRWESFKELDQPEKALWHVQWNSFEDPPEDAVEILLNKDQDKLIKLLEESSKQDPELKIARNFVLKTITNQVFTNLVLHLFEEEGSSLKDYDWESDRKTLKRSLVSVLDDFFPDHSLEELYREYSVDQHGFITMLQEVTDYRESMKGI